MCPQHPRATDNTQHLHVLTRSRKETHSPGDTAHAQVQMHTQKPGGPDRHTYVPRAHRYKLLPCCLSSTPLLPHTHTRAHTCAHARALSASGLSPESVVPPPAPSSLVSPANRGRGNTRAAWARGVPVAETHPSLQARLPGCLLSPWAQRGIRVRAAWRGVGVLPAAPRLQGLTGRLATWPLSPGQGWHHGDRTVQ